MAELCPKGVKNEQRIVSLERDMKDMKTDIKDIKDRLLGRPTWFVTIALTFLSSTCVGLLIALMRR